MKRLPYRFRSPLARPFKPRLANWQRCRVAEAPALRLDGGLKLRRFFLPVADAAAVGRRIIFVSDLHYNATAEEDRRIDALTEALFGLRGDILLLGGDAVGDACRMKGLPRALRRFAACADTALAVPGNWERGKRWLGIDFWRGVYADGGFELLCNESREAGAFYVYGSDELVHGFPELPPERGGEGRFRILLCHRPDTVISFDSGDRLSSWQLALCGHTHGGQWRLPFLGALYVPSFYWRTLDRGWFRRRGEELRMFVSPGAGELSLPGRFACPREAAVVDLVPVAEV